jgi:demethylmenaquinone methyltransferase/2-methoxy-6-polyprenyl-1,4-benzoquinol methylase
MEQEDIGPRLARVASSGRISGGNRVLDVGTGTGILIPYILDMLGDEGTILAIDISSGMLAVARKKFPQQNVEFLEADVSETNFPDGSFDRIFCNSVFPHFSDKHSTLLELKRLLAPGGVLVISHPIGREAVNNIHRDAGDVVAEDRVLKAADMKALLESAGFSEVSVVDEPDFYLAVGVR